MWISASIQNTQAKYTRSKMDKVNSRLVLDSVAKVDSRLLSGLVLCDETLEALCFANIISVA